MTARQKAKLQKKFEATWKKLTPEQQKDFLNIFCKGWPSLKTVMDVFKEDGLLAEIGIAVFDAIGDVLHDKFCPKV